MSARTVQPSRPGWKFWFLWILATVVGAAVGLVLSFPFQLVLEAALGTKRIPPWTAAETGLIVVLKGAEGGVMGLGMGLGQWLVFRKHLNQTRGWILATGLALFLEGAFRWSLPFDTLTWQLGVDTMLSLGAFLGIFQWFVLRGRVPYAGGWIVISVAGWILALVLIVATEFAPQPVESSVGQVLFGVTLLVPFAVAGGGMVWLLRQTAPTRQAIA